MAFMSLLESFCAALHVELQMRFGFTEIFSNCRRWWLGIALKRVSIHDIGWNCRLNYNAHHFLAWKLCHRSAYWFVPLLFDIKCSVLAGLVSFGVRSRHIWWCIKLYLYKYTDSWAWSISCWSCRVVEMYKCYIIIVIFLVYIPCAS